ncbi:hypothetical protein T440DRAFT_555812 [Plenodomus tracheiphilus IPT5]|uniref:NACHT domain-containing protein n=1 Tax=Plenodomus tracheiphilus IPT5 TaxID=1408161 RepID=A0A6A7B497_9PLEO|nr:hypothetical protein T440DRAFT_555812 [Plenodomus tracheiphilus IPT5]
MEALAALGLASNIVQFISFTREIISTSRQIASDAGGLITNLELEAIAKNFHRLDSELQVTQRGGVDATEDRALRVGLEAAVDQALRRDIPPEHDYALWKAVTEAISLALPNDMISAVDGALHNGILSAITLARRNNYHPGMPVTANNVDRSTKDRKDLRLRINIAIDQALREGTSPAEDQELRKLCEGCSHVAGDLLTKIRSLGDSQKLSSGRKKPWANFRQALATVMKAGDIEELEARMDRYQKAVNTALLVSLRRQIKDEQSKGAVRDERMSERLLGFIANARSWQADLIDTLHSSKWQPSNEIDTERFAHQLKIGAGIDTQRFNQQRIHQLLRFDEITERHETIADAHRETFRWVYYQDHEEIATSADADSPAASPSDRQYNSFSDWLSGTGTMYWITGKPGSGKSTLMKYLADEPETLRLAKAWSGANQFIVARYFFWNSGTKMQMSKMGLLQTLLYQSLLGRERLIPSLFANRWTNYTLFGADVRPWTWSELTHALSSLFAIEDQRLLLFIDGLDEFESDPSDLVALILSWTKLSRHGVKMCVSSRPWLIFEESFKGIPWLRMEDLTRLDIQRYVEQNMAASSQWLDLQDYMQEETSKIIAEITEKAVGVFLWVTLVVSSLVEGLRDGDSIEDLWQRLSALPSRLEALFQSILSALNPEYFAQSCQLFQLVLTAFEPPTLLEMVFAQEGVNVAIEARLGRPDPKRLTYSTEMMRRRIASRSKGLLEAPKFPVDGETAKVEYLHRTVRDFFQGPEAWTYIRSGASDYDAPLLLAASSLRMAKMTPQVHRASVFDQFWRASAACIEYARKREDTHGTAPMNILNELEMTGHVYWTKEPLTQKSTYGSWMSIEEPNVPWKHNLTMAKHDPSLRDANVLSSHPPAVASNQWDIWNAVFGVQGYNNYPLEPWDKVTGEIYPEAVELWKPYDLSDYIVSNFNNARNLGKNLAGRIYVYVGTWDDYFLNEGVKEFQKRTDAAGGSGWANITILPEKLHGGNYQDREIWDYLEFLSSWIQDHGPSGTSPLSDDATAPSIRGNQWEDVIARGGRKAAIARQAPPSITPSRVKIGMEVTASVGRWDPGVMLKAQWFIDGKPTCDEFVAKQGATLNYIPLRKGRVQLLVTGRKRNYQTETRRSQEVVIVG